MKPLPDELTGLAFWYAIIHVFLHWIHKGHDMFAFRRVTHQCAPFFSNNTTACT